MESWYVQPGIPSSPHRFLSRWQQLWYTEVLYHLFIVPACPPSLHAPKSLVIFPRRIGTLWLENKSVWRDRTTVFTLGLYRQSYYYSPPTHTRRSQILVTSDGTLFPIQTPISLLFSTTLHLLVSPGKSRATKCQDGAEETVMKARGKASDEMTSSQMAAWTLLNS